MVSDSSAKPAFAPERSTRVEKERTLLDPSIGLHLLKLLEALLSLGVVLHIRLCAFARLGGTEEVLAPILTMELLRYALLLPSEAGGDEDAERRTYLAPVLEEIEDGDEWLLIDLPRGPVQLRGQATVDEDEV
jgi:hypothetical protein